MFIYRIVKNLARTRDLSGLGAFREGGRWNSEGTYMLYTSENSSLAYLETLAHFGIDTPPFLYIIKLDLDTSNLFVLPDKDYPLDWMKPENLISKLTGDYWMMQQKYLGIKVRSIINPYEYNYLLNPLFPGYHDLVKIISVDELKIDTRLV